jgi:HAD superfamily hydrolase (TIGR01509 family)
MKKLIIFDLDGVLVDAKQMHFDALNLALQNLSNDYTISLHEHLTIYDGLNTIEKLKLLTKAKGLPAFEHSNIWIDKQRNTDILIDQVPRNQRLINLFSELKNKGLKIACCSNSIRTTCYKMLSRVGIIEYFDLIISNQDVENSKPHPEMYWKAMSILKMLPSETLIIEDSPHGLMAAQRSGADVYRVKNSEDVNLQKIEKKLNIMKHDNNTKWQDENLNVLIPMAGAGSRFEQAGYTFPKPLIDVNGSPMIQTVVNNLNFDSKYTFLVQKSHRCKYNLDLMLNLIADQCNVVEVDGVTEGAACTTLLAKDIINNESPLILANSDQYVDWNVSEFMYKMQEQDVDAGIVCFNSTHPKWSFVKVDEHGYVTEVAEKQPISDIATVGIYFWKKGSDYVKYAEQMIGKNLRHNNEFYVCPVFNEAIADGKKVKIFMVDKMWGIGTPEDLNYFLEHYQQ